MSIPTRLVGGATSWATLEIPPSSFHFRQRFATASFLARRPRHVPTLVMLDQLPVMMSKAFLSHGVVDCFHSLLYVELRGECRGRSDTQARMYPVPLFQGLCRA